MFVNNADTLGEQPFRASLIQILPSAIGMLPLIELLSTSLSKLRGDPETTRGRESPLPRDQLYNRGETDGGGDMSNPMSYPKLPELR